MYNQAFLQIWQIDSLDLNPCWTNRRFLHTSIKWRKKSRRHRNERDKIRMLNKETSEIHCGNKNQERRRRRRRKKNPSRRVIIITLFTTTLITCYFVWSKGLWKNHATPIYGASFYIKLNLTVLSFTVASRFWKTTLWTVRVLRKGIHMFITAPVPNVPKSENKNVLRRKSPVAFQLQQKHRPLSHVVHDFNFWSKRYRLGFGLSR